MNRIAPCLATPVMQALEIKRGKQCRNTTNESSAVSFYPIPSSLCNVYLNITSRQCIFETDQKIFNGSSTRGTILPRKKHSDIDYMIVFNTSKEGQKKPQTYLIVKAFCGNEGSTSEVFNQPHDSFLNPSISNLFLPSTAMAIRSLPLHLLGQTGWQPILQRPIKRFKTRTSKTIIKSSRWCA